MMLHARLHAIANSGQCLMQGCLPLSTIIFRIMGEEVADLLYADTNIDLRGRKLLQVAMLALQLDLSQV